MADIIETQTIPTNQIMSATEKVIYVDQMKKIQGLRLKNHRLRNLLTEMSRGVDRLVYWKKIVEAELDKEEEK